jgi:hypothetical protein
LPPGGPRFDRALQCVGVEWIISLAIGFGVIPLSLLVRVISRAVFGINVPRTDEEHVDMDIGYGAVAHDVHGDSRDSDGTAHNEKSPDGKDNGKGSVAH